MLPKNKETLRHDRSLSKLMWKGDHLFLAQARPECRALCQHVLDPLLDKVVLYAVADVVELADVLLRLVLLFILDRLADEFKAIDCVICVSCMSFDSRLDRCTVFDEYGFL